MKHPRTAIGALSLSAAAFVALVAHEGYSDKPIIPISGDRLTIGFGSTFNPDGTPVKMGDTTTPPKALRLAVSHIGKDEVQLKRCVTAPLYQHEYDAYVSLAYNIGTVAFCKSTLVKKLNAGDYEGACAEILRWDMAGGKKVRGLANRRVSEFKACVGE